MTLKTKSQLLNDIITFFADNTSGNITESVLRARATDWVDSLTSEMSSKFFGSQEANTLTTVINTQGTYEAINATLVMDSSSVDFTVSGAVATYTGPSTKKFVIAAAFSGLKLGPGANNYAIKIYVNGVSVGVPCEQEFASTTSDNSLSSLTVANVSQNQTVEARITSTDGTDNMDVKNIHMLIGEWV